MRAAALLALLALAACARDLPRPLTAAEIVNGVGTDLPPAKQESRP